MSDKPENKFFRLALIVVLVTIAVVLVLAAIAIPNFLKAKIRSDIYKTVVDFRSIELAIGAYKEVNGAYPAMHPLEDFCDNRDSLQEAGGIEYYTIEPGDESLEGITTPFEYVPYIFNDFFSDRKHPWPYAYYANDDFWVVFSPGPDRDYDLGYDIHLTGTPEEIRENLISVTYDPTNGTKSSGDIWRANLRLRDFN